MPCSSRKTPESSGRRFKFRRQTEIAERFVRTIRSECLDWLLIVSAQHVERALPAYIDHYNVTIERIGA
jgi:hypothetical protein